MATHAVVLGGGIAGLLAADACRRHLDHVTVIEPRVRHEDRQVPHAAQLHVLLAGGLRSIERRCPGITEELRTAGAVAGSGPALVQYYRGRRKPDSAGVTVVGMSRPLLESRVRGRTLDRATISEVRGRATALRVENGRVSGVDYRDDTGEHRLDADLVVDATGRNSRVTRWLADVGYPQPPAVELPIDIGYATAAFRHEDDLPGITMVHALPGMGAASATQDTAAAIRVENDLWHVVLVGYADRRPGPDPDGFVRRCRAVPAPPLWAIAEKHRLDGPITCYRLPASRRHRITSGSALPGGLVIAGDALAGFNPVYGQGMTVAALEADLLDSYLAAGPDLSRQADPYLTAAQEVVAAAWATSGLGDHDLPHVPVPRPRGHRVRMAAAKLITQATVTSPAVNQVFLDVVHMIAPPEALQRPSVLANAVTAVTTAPFRRS